MTTFFQHDNPALTLATSSGSYNIFGKPARSLLLALPAFGITFGLFQLMAQLVGTDAVYTPREPVPVDVTAQTPRQDSPADRIIRVIPPPPVQTEPPKQPTQVADPFTTGLEVPLSLSSPEIALAGPSAAPPAAMDKTAVPLVRIEPKYPPVAARDGVSGWVRLRFNIQPDGRVSDVQVTAAEPRRVFEQEAIRALKNWKYQPKLANGRAVTQSNLEVQLDFQLDNNK